jgi:hypothetical protein
MIKERHLKAPAQVGATAHPDDAALTNLERAVTSHGMSVAGALARAYVLGMDRGAERPVEVLNTIAREWRATQGYEVGAVNVAKWIREEAPDLAALLDALRCTS